MCAKPGEGCGVRGFARIPQVCSVFAPSRLDASIVMYRDTTGCGGFRTLSPPLEGTMRQEGDGIDSYQPPSRASNTSVYHTRPRQHARTWRQGTGGTSHENTRRHSYLCVGSPVLADKACSWQASWHISLPKELHQWNP